MSQKPLAERLVPVNQALDRLRGQSAHDSDLIDVLDGLVSVVEELAKYKWAEPRPSPDGADSVTARY